MFRSADVAGAIQSKAGGPGIEVVHRGHMDAIYDSALDIESEILANSMLESLGMKKPPRRIYNRLRKEADWRILSEGGIYTINGKGTDRGACWKICYKLAEHTRSWC